MVFSDHKPSQYIAKIANHNIRLLIWALELANYDVEVRHIKGSENTMADFCHDQTLHVSLYFEDMIVHS